MRAFGALADPTRAEIVARLAQRARSVKEIVELFPISQPSISKHLRILREAGLVSVEPSGRERRYRLELGPLREIDAWLEALPRALGEAPRRARGPHGRGGEVVNEPGEITICFSPGAASMRGTSASTPWMTPLDGSRRAPTRSRAGARLERAHHQHARVVAQRVAGAELGVRTFSRTLRRSSRRRHVGRTPARGGLPASSAATFSAPRLDVRGAPLGRSVATRDSSAAPIRCRWPRPTACGSTRCSVPRRDRMGFRTRRNP